MAPLGGIWVPMAQRILKQAMSAGSRMTEVVRINISAASRLRLEPATVRAVIHGHGTRQPVHPLALRRQLKRSGTRWYHSHRRTTSSSTSSSASTSSPFSFSAGFHAALRRFISTTGGRSSAAAPRFVDRVAFLQSSIGSQAVWRASGRAPFASTLRPSLTGGALPRTAGGYATGAAGRGGARYFSHTPAAPAQVVQNVSQAMRAFWLSGQRARFDGTDTRGRPRYKAISALEEETARRLAVPSLPKMAPGAFVDFSLNPTITALAPLAVATAAAAAAAAAATSTVTMSAAGSSAATFPSKMATGFAPSFAAAGCCSSPVTNTCATTLGTEGFLDVLSVDFSRALKELGAVMADLKRLAGLGDLPVLLEKDAVLRVRFPGVDAVTVDRLCEDLGITRGLVGQDPGFDAAVGTATALRFPFAPDATAAGADAEVVSLTSPGGSTRSHDSSALDEDIYADYDHNHDFDYDDMDGYDALFDESAPWLSLPPSSQRGGDGYANMSPPVPVSSGEHASTEFEGVQGVYRFLEACDQAQGRF